MYIFIPMFATSINQSINVWSKIFKLKNYWIKKINDKTLSNHYI